MIETIGPTRTGLGLEGKVAVVVEGTAGLGLAAAGTLCDHGVRVVVTCAEDDPLAERARIVLSGKAGHASVVPVDLGDAGAVEALLEEVVRGSGGLDIFVHHVVSPDPAPLLNAGGALGKAFTRGGRVVVVGYTVLPMAGPVRALAVRLAQHQVAVNAVVTPVVDHGPANMDPDLVRRLAVRCPAGRLTTPGDVADAVTLLCAGQAAWIQGQVITVDGGLGLVDLPGELT